jgi:hypothetical protein
MSRATIHIPFHHIDAIRESLETGRQIASEQRDGANDDGRLREIEALLDQLVKPPATSSPSVSGSREILWQAAYDALCAGAEAFAADCNELWQGGLTVPEGRKALRLLEEQLDLLDALGASPPR